MAGEFVLLNSQICMRGYDFTGLANQGSVDVKVDIQEYLCFSTLPMTYKKRLPGAEDGELALAGYYDTATVETALRQNFNVTDTLVMFGQSMAIGSPWVLMKIVQGAYQRGGGVGSVMPFSITALSQGEPIVDTAELFEFGNWTATDNGVARELGPVGANQYLYVGLQTTGVIGTTPTADVEFESSAIGDFSDAETRATFIQITDAHDENRAQMIAVAGPITDTHFRFRRTIGGSGSPTFTVRGAAGIL
jgi:hypothetical protein